MRCALLILAVVLSACAAKPQHTVHPETRAGFGWFGALAGDCWTGIDAEGKIVDTQCYDWQYGRFLRGTIAMPGGFAGESVFAWDAATQHVRFWFWANDGSSGEATAHFDGHWLRFSSPTRKDLRNSWKRVDADSFLVLREVKDSAGWQEQRVVTYRRAL